MLNGYIKALTPHAIAITIFIAISGAYFMPALSGKVLNQSDNVQALGMQKEINETQNQGKAHPLWTNSMFGGMPVYQIHLPNGNNFTVYLSKIFLLGGHYMNPFYMSFLMMIMFYILMVAMGVDWRIGIIGAVAYALATNHIVLTEAGHTTKVLTMAYLPPTLAGIILAFRGKYLAGFALTALFMSLQILANHIQITYYFFLALIFLGGFEFYRALQKKELPNFFKAVAVLVLAGLIGVGANTARLWTTYEYVDETIRGTSEITEAGPYSQQSSTVKGGEGLTKDYIFSWSYGIGETFTVLVPDYMGRATGNLIVSSEGQLRTDTKSAQAFQSEVVPRLQQAGENAQQLQQQVISASNPFRGDVPFTSGPIYFGAVICFLFVLGLILVKGPMKWWLLTATVLMAFLGWGRNFGALNFFLYEHFPMFNKFRAVMMALGVGQLFVTALGMLAVKELVFGKDTNAKEKTKAVLLAGGITGGLTLLLWLGAMMGFISMAGPRDGEVLAQFPNLMSAVYADRAAMLQSDALRSFLFIALSTGAFWLFTTKRVQWVYAVIAVGALTLIDFWGVDKRFLDNDSFQTKQVNRTQVTPQPVDERIMQDEEIHFRVMDFASARFGRGDGNPFASSKASYFHKSMGGYHAAKLKRFQDLCEYYLFNMGATPQNQAILGMFNTKYFIMNNPQKNNQPTAFTNPKATGPAWFVREYEVVEDADAEIKALANLEPQYKAIVEKKYADYLNGLQLDSTITPGDYIKMTTYSPDKMVYEVNSTKERLAMFAEMYYPPSKGWNVYIDGKKQEPAFIKANYAIRAARVPAGQYTLEMRFEPKSFYTGRTIALICSLLVFAAMGFLIFWAYKKFNPEELGGEEPAIQPSANNKARESSRIASKKEVKEQPKKSNTSHRKPPKKKRRK